MKAPPCRYCGQKGEQEQVSLLEAQDAPIIQSRTMNLAVFDLDGTLTTTFAVDVQCFVQAFRIALNIERLNTNWTEYHDVTDSGLVTRAQGT